MMVCWISSGSGCSKTGPAGPVALRVAVSLSGALRSSAPIAFASVAAAMDPLAALDLAEATNETAEITRSAAAACRRYCN